MEIFFTIEITLNVFQLTACYLLHVSVEHIMFIGGESCNFIWIIDYNFVEKSNRS